MENKMEIKDIAAERERLTGIFRKMVAERKEYERTAEERILNDPEIQEALKKVHQQNSKQSTSVTHV